MPNKAGSHDAALVPWAFVLSNEGRTAKRTCRGYPLSPCADREGFYAGQPEQALERPSIGVLPDAD